MFSITHSLQILGKHYKIFTVLSPKSKNTEKRTVYEDFCHLQSQVACGKNVSGLTLEFIVIGYQ
jgi:hypothetical protein